MAATAGGAAAYPSNAAFVQQYVTTLLATSFPNLRPQQVQVGARRASERAILASLSSRGGVLVQPPPQQSVCACGVGSA